MAILTGFPPSNLISPSVRIAEKDLSFIAPEQTGHRAGLVGFASKGPINVPTLVTTSRQLHTVFGQPHPDVGDPYLLYAAEQYLQIANELFIVRVADTAPTSDEAAVVASVDVLTAGGPVVIEGNVAVGGGGWVFPSDTFFRWRLNGVLASKVLVVIAGTYSDPQDLVDDLNSQLSAEFDGIQFGLVGSGTARKLKVYTTFAYGPVASVELISVTSSLYGPTSVVGMGTGMTAGSITGTLTQYPATSIPNPGDFDFSGFATDTINLQIVIDGTDNPLIDNVVQTVIIPSVDYPTTADVATVINDAITMGDIPGGFVASVTSNALVLTTLHVGDDAKLLVKSSSTADTLLGLDNLTHSGSTGAPCITAPGATYTCGKVTGDANNSGEICFSVTADTAGIDGNNTQLVITSHIADGNFTMEIYSYGNQVEAWGNLSKDPSSRFYVESYMATVSDYIRVTDNAGTLALPQDASGSAPLQLSGGTDGIPSDPNVQDSLLIGSITAMTGLAALSDPEQVDIDLIAIPGHTSTDIVNGLIDFCQLRQDCFSIVDAPFGLTVNEVTHWQNGTHPLNDVRFDSDFAALYWPWCKIRDTFNKIDVWAPPSGGVMAAYARSDSISAPWFAPAGTTRGLVPSVLDVFSRPSLIERDSMYGNRNAVNPIIHFVDLDGFLIWGQKTLQRTPSALDRVNVRRMMLYVEKRIKADSRSLLFEPNDASVRSSFIRIATRTLKRVKESRGIADFIIKCDEELNTPDVIDRNELRARIGIQPTRAVEFIFIEFSIHRTGDFGEASSNF